MNETIRLWNGMWIADQVHKARIADNVRTMQQRCGSQLVLLQSSIESIIAEDASRPRKLSAAPDDRIPRSACPAGPFAHSLNTGLLSAASSPVGRASCKILDKGEKSLPLSGWTASVRAHAIHVALFRAAVGRARN